MTFSLVLCVSAVLALASILIPRYVFNDDWDNVLMVAKGIIVIFWCTLIGHDLYRRLSRWLFGP